MNRNYKVNKRVMIVGGVFSVGETFPTLFGRLSHYWENASKTFGKLSTVGKTSQKLLGDFLTTNKQMND
jgi:hypothetical protein